MRPGLGLENAEPRPRKASNAEPPALTGDRHGHSYAYASSPTTFFLSRDPDGSKSQADRTAPTTALPAAGTSPHDGADEGDRAAKRPAEVRSLSRRRSTIKPTSREHLRTASSATNVESADLGPVRAATPSSLPSRDVSPPGSPKSVSTRSLAKSDDELTNDETGSQAIASSEEDGDGDGDMPAVVQDSQPELIMPSIKMPSRRPFTRRGKQLGRLKIMVVGRKGVGKTSLIKSIVQLCEDIVHVDPVSSSSAHATPRDSHAALDMVNEVYASTKPYPGWWSHVEESRILRRRKSMGDSVLERNVCFVDTSDAAKVDRIIHYVEQQLVNAIAAADQLTSDFWALLSGRGASHVDVILYLVSKDTMHEDCECVRHLSELCNVIPLIAKSDLLTAEDRDAIKQEPDLGLGALPRLPTTLASDAEAHALATAPYTVTSINGPDLDTMDASLLMSPEYIQPLLPSELGLLVQHMFDPDTVAYLRHTAARKLVAWHARHPRLTAAPSPSLPSEHNSTLASPLPTSLSNSGVLIAVGSEASLNTSNSWALARVADHTQREERLAQVRLSKWASEMQLSLQRERERYERLARGERAVWLVERMGEEVRDGVIQPGPCQALVPQPPKGGRGPGDFASYPMHDPLGLLRWQESMRTRGWIALQVVGSFGVVGGLAFWIAKTCGLTASIADWAQGWHAALSGHE